MALKQVRFRNALPTEQKPFCQEHDMGILRMFSMICPPGERLTAGRKINR
jgi:hypothetical protein